MLVNVAGGVSLRPVNSRSRKQTCAQETRGASIAAQHGGSQEREASLSQRVDEETPPDHRPPTLPVVSPLKAPDGPGVVPGVLAPAPPDHPGSVPRMEPMTFGDVARWTTFGRWCIVGGPAPRAGVLYEPGFAGQGYSEPQPSHIPQLGPLLRRSSPPANQEASSLL